jgi:hypothetical protein
MRNLSALMNVVPTLFGASMPGAFLPLSEFVPRLVLSATLGSIGILALFESVYLKSQAAAFGSRRILAWLVLFRVAVLVLLVCSAAVSLIS